MPFQKGNRYGKGRPRGTTKLLQEADKNHLEKVISLLLESAEEDIAKLSPNQRISALLKFLEYRLPKLRSMEFDGDIGLTNEQETDAIALKLFKKLQSDGRTIKYQGFDS